MQKVWNSGIRGRSALLGYLIFFLCCLMCLTRAENGMRYCCVLWTVLATAMYPARAFVVLHFSQHLAQSSARRFACHGPACRMMMQNEQNGHIANSNDSNRKTHRVVLLRHGQSTWNRDDRHIGWTGDSMSIAVCGMLSFDHAARIFSSSSRPGRDVPHINKNNRTKTAAAKR